MSRCVQTFDWYCTYSAFVKYPDALTFSKIGFLTALFQNGLKLDPLLSTSLKHLWQNCSFESWVWRCKLGTPVFVEFLPFFSAEPLKLCEVGSRALLHSYFQVSPEMFDRVQVRALAGPLKDIQRLVPKPLLRCLGCGLRVVVLLEGEPSPPVWGPEHSGAGFHQEPLCTLLSSSLPQSWLVSQSLPLKNIPTAWCCHHHASP